MEVAALGAAALAAFAAPAGAKPLQVGDKAPAVTGVTDSGEKLNLADVYKGQKYTLVYFFPKADTPGCTAQGCSLRDAYAQLQASGVAVVGVSLDSVEAQRKFREKFHFPFTLIADPDKAVVTAFGVPLRAIPGIGSFATRQAYLIENGTIVWADYKASTKEQAADVLKVIAGRNG
jgi:peroxiredoxin Q/BCP